MFLFPLRREKQGGLGRCVGYTGAVKIVHHGVSASKNRAKLSFISFRRVLLRPLLTRADESINTRRTSRRIAAWIVLAFFLYAQHTTLLSPPTFSESSYRSSAHRNVRRAIDVSNRSVRNRRLRASNERFQPRSNIYIYTYI